MLAFQKHEAAPASAPAPARGRHVTSITGRVAARLFFQTHLHEEAAVVRKHSTLWSVTWVLLLYTESHVQGKSDKHRSDLNTSFWVKRKKKKFCFGTFTGEYSEFEAAETQTTRGRSCPVICFFLILGPEKLWGYWLKHFITELFRSVLLEKRSCCGQKSFIMRHVFIKKKNVAG